MSATTTDFLDATCARRTECHLPPGCVCEGADCPRYSYRRPERTGTWAHARPVEIRPHEMASGLPRWSGVGGRGARGVTRRVALQSKGGRGA